MSQITFVKHQLMIASQYMYSQCLREQLPLDRKIKELFVISEPKQLSSSV